MSDTAYPVFQHYGTNAQRLAFTPSPASGTQPIYIWYETDTGITYLYDTSWHVISNAGGGITQLTKAVLAGPGSGSQAASLNSDGADVNTQESTNSTSYTDLTTPGPAVTLTTGTSVLISISCWTAKTTSGNTGFMSFAVSGATTIVGSDANGAQFSAVAANSALPMSRTKKLTGLTAGSNTFTAKYRVDGGTFDFANRSIVVLTL